MSDAPSPQNETTSQQAEPSKPESKPQKKGRSTGERIIVWGLIGLLAVFALVEGMARYGFTETLAALEPVAESTDDVRFPMNEVVRGLPIKSGPEQQGLQWVVTYRWPSLVRNYEVRLTVESDADDAQVVAFMTPEAEAPSVSAEAGSGDPGDQEGEEPGMPSEPGDEPAEPGGDETGEEQPQEPAEEKRETSDDEKPDSDETD